MFWYEEDIKQLEKKITLLKVEDYAVFYGSSSIRLWNNLEKEFNNFNGVNLGFGGATLAACVWYFDRIFSKINPSSFIIYAGDNDIGDNRHPEEVFIFYQQLVYRIRSRFGEIPIFFISIKPSITRYHIIDRIEYTNKIISREINTAHNNTFYINLYDKMLDESGFPIKDYYLHDGLHLSPKGYDFWRKEIFECLNEHLPSESAL